MGQVVLASSSLFSYASGYGCSKCTCTHTEAKGRCEHHHKLKDQFNFLLHSSKHQPPSPSTLISKDWKQFYAEERTWRQTAGFEEIFSWKKPFLCFSTNLTTKWATWQERRVWLNNYQVTTQHYEKWSQKPNKKPLQKFNNPISFKVNCPACLIISELTLNFRTLAPVPLFI